MRHEIKEKLNQVREIIFEGDKYYIDIISIDNVLDKVISIFKTIYDIVPYKPIFRPKLGFYVCVFPLEKNLFLLV